MFAIKTQMNSECFCLLQEAEKSSIACLKPLCLKKNVSLFFTLQSFMNPLLFVILVHEIVYFTQRSSKNISNCAVILFVVRKTSCMCAFLPSKWSVYLEMVFGLLWDYCDDLPLQSLDTALINRAEYSSCTWQRAGSHPLSCYPNVAEIQYKRVAFFLQLTQIHCTLGLILLVWKAPHEHNTLMWDTVLHDWSEHPFYSSHDSAVEMLTCMETSDLT